MRRNQKKPDALRDLRKRLGSPSSDVRYQAYLDAQNLSAEQLWEIIAVPARQAQRSLHLQSVGCVGGALWVLAVLMLLNSSHPAYSAGFFRLVLGVVLFCPLWCLYSFIHNVQPGNLYISLSRVWEHREEPEFVGPMLLIHTGLLERNVYASVRRSLLRLLPTLDDTHTRLWTVPHKAALLELARHSWGDLELKFFALDALARVGEVNSIPVVREVVQMETSHIAIQLYMAHLSRDTTIKRELDRIGRRASTGNNTAFVPPSTLFDRLDTEQRETYMAVALYLKRKAEDSLNSILARQQQQQQTTVLLRAAGQPNMAQAQGLLRPVHDAGADTPNEQLLRPK